MNPHSQVIYVTDDGDLLPINKLLPTENIRRRGDDWFNHIRSSLVAVKGELTPFNLSA